MQAIPALMWPYEVSNSLLHPRFNRGIRVGVPELGRTRLRVCSRVMRHRARVRASQRS